MEKNKHTYLTRVIWCKIRYYQQLHKISNESLAEKLDIKPRTLTAYDRNAENIRLGQLEQFLNSYAITLDELLSQ